MVSQGDEFEGIQKPFSSTCRSKNNGTRCLKWTANFVE